MEHPARLVALQADASTGLDGLLVGKEVVAGDAVETLHPRRLQCLGPVTLDAGVDGPGELMDGSGVATHTAHAPFPYVDPVALRLVDLRPVPVMADVAVGAGIDGNLR
jgi:hypothetical protein